MTRYKCGLVVLAALLPLLPFAGPVGGSTLTCANTNPTTVSMGAPVILAGSIVSEKDRTYGQLTYPDSTTGAALTAMLGMDGINGNWRYNLGLLTDPGAYALTVFPDNSDSTPCVCGFTLTVATKDGGKKKHKEPATPAAVGSPHQQGATAKGGANGELIKITEVRAFCVDGQQIVQVRGNVASPALNMALQGHMTADIMTDAGITKVHFFADQVFRSAVPASRSTDVLAEFNVTKYPRAVYDVRLSSINPTAIKTRKHAVIVGHTVCAMYHR